MMDERRLQRALRAGPSGERVYVPRGLERPRRSRVPRVAVGLAAAAVAIAFLTVTFVRQPTPPPVAADILADIRAAGLLRVAVTNGSPQVLMPSGAYSGFDMDVAAALGERLGVPTHADVVDPSAITDEDSVGQWDLALASVVTTDSPPPDLLAGRGYYTRAGAVVVPAGSNLATLSDLGGRRVCVVKDGLGARWLDGTLRLAGGIAAPAPTPSTLVSEHDLDGCIESLAGGITEAVVVDWVMAVPSSAGLTTLLDVPFAGVASPLVDGRRAGATAFLAELDRALAELRANGTLRQLSERRFGGSDLTVPPTP